MIVMIMRVMVVIVTLTMRVITMVINQLLS